MRRFGERARFCVEIGASTPPSLRTVDLWAGGRRLTTDDDTAYVPALAHRMRSTAAEVRRRDVSPSPFPRCSPEEVFRRLDADAEAGGSDLPQRFRLISDWTEIVDNVTSYGYRDGDDLVIVFGYWRATHPFPEDLGRVFVARIAADEFVTVVEQAAGFLVAGLGR